MRWPGAASPHLSTFVFFVGNFWVEAKNGEMPLTLHLAPEFTLLFLQNLRVSQGLQQAAPNSGLICQLFMKKVLSLTIFFGFRR